MKIGAISAEAAGGAWADGKARDKLADRASDLERDVRMFFETASAIELSLHEERALLDLSQREMALLRMAPANAFKLGGNKLERRVAYAIPILRRMIAAMSS